MASSATMPLRWRHREKVRLARVAGAGAIAALALGLLAGPAAAAGTGYGPPPPPVPPPPGGFSTIVTSQTVPPTGGTVTATYKGEKVTLRVPAGDFRTPVQVTVIAPSYVFPQLPKDAVAFEVIFTAYGRKVSGTFPKPVVFVITSPLIKAGDVVEIWTGTRWEIYATASVVNGSARITVTSDASFAVEPPPICTGHPSGGQSRERNLCTGHKVRRASLRRG